MKTANILSALRNASSPAASLAAWQNLPLGKRVTAIRKHATPGYPCRPCGSPPEMALSDWRKAIVSDAAFTLAPVPELSATDAKNPLLRCPSPLLKSSPEVLDAFAGRDCGLNHRGWFTDEFQDETLETYAVRLTRFPHLLFYAVKDSCNGDFRVSLKDWEEIDFSDCESEYDTSASVEDAARSLVRSYDSATQREAEESIEYYRKDRIEQDII